MLVVLVILCPPLAVLITAPSRVAKNLGLTLLLYVPGVLHARGIVEQYQATRRYESLMRLAGIARAHAGFSHGSQLLRRLTPASHPLLFVGRPRLPADCLDFSPSVPANHRAFFSTWQRTSPLPRRSRSGSSA